MKELIIHIGIHKTGTTALQYFLHGNYQKFLDMGVLFPQSGRVGESNHSNIAWEFLPLKKFYPEQGGIEEVLQEISSKKCDTVILSGEEFEFLKHDQVKQFASKLPKGIETKIVIYLRRHDEVFRSEYSEWAKYGIVDAKFNFFCRFFTKHTRFFYHLLLENWASVFGRENLIVRVFDRDTMVGGDTAEDFFHCLNMEHIYEQGDNTGVRVNPSLRHKTVAACVLVTKMINSLTPESLNCEKHLVMKKVIELANEELNDNEDKFVGFNGNEARIVANNFTKSNRIVVNNYMQPKKGKLFAAEPPIYPDNSSNGQLTSEDLKKVLSWFDTFLLSY